MKRAFLWVQFIAATLVVIGVFLQAFSIAAFVRGAGDGALDMHQAVGGITYLLEIVVFLAALAAWWKQWGEVALAFSLPVLGTLQLFFVGDTHKEAGWVSGLHGLLALVVAVLAAVIAHRAMKGLGLGKSATTP